MLALFIFVVVVVIVVVVALAFVVVAVAVLIDILCQWNLTTRNLGKVSGESQQWERSATYPYVQFQIITWWNCTELCQGKDFLLPPDL